MQCAAVTKCSLPSLRAAAPAVRRVAASRPALQSAGRRNVAVPAKKPADFDELLEMVAEKFEAVENKPVVVGWLVGAFSAIVIAEWFIHLPLFNVLLGFPIQFVGLVVTPYLALRYYVDKEGDLLDDAEELVAKVTKKLPGL